MKKQFSSNSLNTLFIGKVLMEYAQLDSTNSEAVRLLQNGNIAEGTVIMAHEQLAGRGQMGNRWYSGKEENLSISMVLYPKIAPKEQFLLNQIISLGIYDTLVALGVPDVKIKWPNDILIHHKKVAGILIQNAISHHRIHHSIVGVGLNVNSRSFPSDLPDATSLALEMGSSFVLMDVLHPLCNAWEKRYLQSKQDATAIQQAYLQQLYRLHEVASYQEPGGKAFAGIIRGVGADGSLQLDTDAGRKSYAFKAVKYLK